MLRHWATILRYVHTLRHLRVSQWVWQAQHRFLPKRPPSNDLAPPLRHMAKPLQNLPARDAQFTEKTIRILNREVPLSLLEDGWRIPGQSDLWHYHLHYFEDVVAEDAVARRSQHHRLIADWIQKNPPLTPVAWDAYPISRRSCFWMLAECSRAGLLTKTSTHSLALQIRFLARNLEKHLLANHFFVNLKALWIAGCFFDGDEANAWRTQAEAMLKRELAEQFLPGGAHYEIAPMYHALLLEDLLDMLNIAEAYAIAPPHGLREIIPRALQYLQHVTHPDGTLAHMHDTAQHIALPTSALLAYAKRLGIVPETLPMEQPLIRLERGPWYVLFDPVSRGPDYQPGHSHAQALCLELSYKQQRVFINQGTSSYACDARRRYERSTAAHNTLGLNAHNSSDVWASFRMGARAQAFGIASHGIEAATSHASAAHRGYAPIMHARHLALTDNGLTIIDSLDGDGEQDVAVYLHAAPGITLSRTSVTLPDGEVLRVKGWCGAETMASDYGSSFHKREATQTLVFRARVCLPWEGKIIIAKETA